MNVWCEHQGQNIKCELNVRWGVDGVTDIVRHGQLRWLGHLERKGGSDWVSPRRSFEMAGPKGN